MGLASKLATNVGIQHAHASQGPMPAGFPGNTYPPGPPSAPMIGQTLLRTGMPPFPAGILPLNGASQPQQQQQQQGSTPSSYPPSLPSGMPPRGMPPPSSMHPGGMPPPSSMPPGGIPPQGFPPSFRAPMSSGGLTSVASAPPYPAALSPASNGAPPSPFLCGGPPSSPMQSSPAGGAVPSTSSSSSFMPPSPITVSAPSSLPPPVYNTFSYPPARPTGMPPGGTMGGMPPIMGGAPQYMQQQGFPSMGGPMQMQQQRQGPGPGPYSGSGPFPQQQQQQMGGMPPSRAIAPYTSSGMMPAGPGAGGGYGGPMMGPGGPAAAAAAGAGQGLISDLEQKLQQIVAANQLQQFYPPHTLPSVAARLAQQVNFDDLAARWRMPKELAIDLASLALYDIVMFADDSGSMAFEENGERIDDLKLIASKVAEVATMFDDDGILMRFMNSPVQGNGLRCQQDVAALLAQLQYRGLTPLASALEEKVLNPIVYQLANSGRLQKPVLIITITDGEPTDNPRDLVVKVIREARRRLQNMYGPKAVAFEFAQVGKDQRAQAFLSRLDTDPEVGGSIDCTSYFELEQAEYAQKGVQLSPEAWLVKMMVGAIDPSYDEQDES